jgi:hypothetical protein
LPQHKGPFFFFQVFQHCCVKFFWQTHLQVQAQICAALSSWLPGPILARLVLLTCVPFSKRSSRHSWQPQRARLYAFPVSRLVEQCGMPWRLWNAGECGNIGIERRFCDMHRAW